MRHIALVTTILAVILIGISCKNQGVKKEITQNSGSTNVNVYYFHFTRRCATCLAVEENARKAVETLYANELKTGEYAFTALNLDEANNKEIAKSLGVGGQTLLVVRGDKKIDITSAGFLNAHEPAKMKEEIKSAVDKVLF
jgi:hypothetical protein